MKVTLISYADSKFKANQRRLTNSAKKKGCFNKIIEFGPEDIEQSFYQKNESILNQGRGGGYWLWKPYFIDKVLSTMSDGEFLFYCDSGAIITRKIDSLISTLTRSNQDVMGFELPLIESQWTKKELFINLKCDEPRFYDTNQLLATFILIKKSNTSQNFIKDYLKYSCDEMNLTDIQDSNILERGDFIDHRHDQSIFSLLYKKYNFQPFRDPSQFGKFPEAYTSMKFKRYDYSKLYNLENGRKFRKYLYPNSPYPSIVYHSRIVNPWKSLVKFQLKKILSRIGVCKC